MKEFNYVIQDALGIHARPAGILVKEAKKFSSKIIIEAGEKSAEATKLLAIMGLGIKQGAEVRIRIEGEDEEAAEKGIKTFFQENL